MAGLDVVVRFRTAPAWSAGSGARIPRRYVQISKDQQCLLEREEAWAPSRCVNVPKELLQALIEAHRPKPAQSSSKRTLAVEPASSVTSTPDQSGQEATLAKEDERDDAVEAEDEDDNGSTLTSWPPTPQRPVRDPSQPEEPDRVSELPDQCLPTLQVPQPIPRAISRAVFTATDFPSSSAASETSLELEVPKAITDTAGPTQGHVVPLLPRPTPPSAQIIPCTLPDHTSPMKPLGTKRRRLMKAITAKFSPEPVDSSRQAKSMDRPPLPPPPSSHIPSSSPLARGPLLDDSASSALPATFSVNESHPSQFLHEDDAGRGHVLLEKAAQQHSRSPEMRPSDESTSEILFSNFRLVYPRHQGSVRDFARGLMCLKNLEERRALPEFLYDDFMRVFCGEYMEYIAGLGPGEVPLPAVQWYNKNVSDPLFTKRFLTRSNIDDILDKFSDEIRSIRLSLGRSTVPSEVPSLDTAGAPARPPLTSSNNLPSAMAVSFQGPKLHLGELASDPIDVSDMSQHAVGPPKESLHASSISVLPRHKDRHLSSWAPRVSRQGKENIASIPSSLQSQIGFSSSIIGQAIASPQPIDSIGPGSAVPRPGAALTQLTRPEHNTTTRHKARISPRFSSGSTAGDPTAVFKKPRSSAPKDPSRRNKRWEEFLRKSISSSAPGNSAA